MDYYTLLLLCEDLHLKWLYFWFFSIPERCQTCPYCQHNCMHLETVTYQLTGATSHTCEFDMAREDRYETVRGMQGRLCDLSHVIAMTIG